MSEYERDIAIMEAKMAATSDKYFNAQPYAVCTPQQLFEAGFKAAWRERGIVSPVAPEWQPMETAPKDGTAILAALKLSDIPCPVRFHSGGWETTWDKYPLSEHNDGPICWMPIPAAPTKEQM